MSQAEHTKGAIRYDFEPGFCGELIASDGTTVATFNDEPSPDNARRLVACWNACEGIETGALELMTGPLSIENQIKYKPQPPTRKSKYREQRDVLLEMLLKCRDMVGHTDNIFMIDAAIAQVKGSTS